MSDTLFSTQYPNAIYLGSSTVKNLRVGETIVWPRTPSVTPSLSISATPSLSISATRTPSITPTTTPSLSISATRTPSITPTTTPSLSISATRTPSITPTTTPSLSISATRTPSITPTTTPSLSISATRTPSITPTTTPSLSISATRTPSITPTTTPSLSISATPSLSISATITPTITPTASLTCIFPTSGLQAYWKFEEASGTLYDETGNGYNLTTVSGINYRETGKSNYCVSGTTASCSAIGPTTGLTLSDITISAWIKLSNTANDNEIYCKFGYTPAANGVRAYISSGGVPTFIIYNEDVNKFDYAGAFDVNDGAWHHIVWTFNSSTYSIRTWVDNVSGNTVTTDSIIPNYPAAAPLYIGNSVNEDDGFLGSLDELGVWDRVLSPTEIGNLYHSGVGCFYSAGPQPSPTVTPSLSITPTITPSITTTSSITPTRTPSLSISQSIGATPSLSISATRTPSITPTITPTPSIGINPCADSLLAYWKCDEMSGQTLYDSSSNYNHGVLESGAEFTSGGKRNYGVNFTTSSSDIQINKITITGSTLTFACWIKLDTLPSTAGRDFVIISMNHSDTPYYSFYVRIDNPGDNIEVIVNNTTPTGYIAITADDIVSTGTWYYLVVVVQGSGQTLKIYLNNADVTGSSNTFTGTFFQCDRDWSIGNGWYDGEGTVGFDGIMDEISIWNRVLTTTELSFLYNGGNGYQCFTGGTASCTFPTSGLTAYYNLNESSGTIVDSVNGYDSTAVDATYGASGKNNTCLYFDGTDMVTLEDTSDWSVASDDSLTIALWVNLEADTAGYINLFGTYESAHGPQFFLNHSATNVYEMCWFVTSSSVVSGLVTLTPGIWYHLAMVKNGRTITFYMNSTEIANNGLDATYSTVNPSAMYIGNDLDSEAFYGRIDEVGYWKRALSKTEINNLCCRGSGTFYSP